MATYCGHSNAPVEYALKEEELNLRLVSQQKWHYIDEFTIVVWLNITLMTSQAGILVLW